MELQDARKQAVTQHPVGHQVPSSLVAETGHFAGPFLRYHQSLPGSGRWTGSALVVTKALGSGVEAPPPALVVLPEGEDGAAAGAELAPALLDHEGGWHFWRFELEFQLRNYQRPVQYLVRHRTESTPTYTFWLPGADHPMHWAYFSCNGLSSGECHAWDPARGPCVTPDANEYKDPTYLWRDMKQARAAGWKGARRTLGQSASTPWIKPTTAYARTQVHEAFPLHVLAQATNFYLTNYIDSFSATDVDVMFASVPTVMMWDDHDIWDGWGSYDREMHESPVFQGLFAVAKRFYLLFQQHTTLERNAGRKEFLTNDGRRGQGTGWRHAAAGGHHQSVGTTNPRTHPPRHPTPSFHSSFDYLKWLGPQVALLGLDMRTQRTKTLIMPPAQLQLARRTVMALPEGVQHLVVMSGMPLAECILGCLARCTRSNTSFKQMARKTGLLDRFDQPEILDDLVDGWAADVHEEERLGFIRLLQDFALQKQLRVSALSGDAHVGGVGQLYSAPKVHDLATDPLYMPQIISSAIANAPPPVGVVKMLMRTHRAKRLDHRTKEKMVRAFYPRHPRTDKLIRQRNWCDVSQVIPPFAPPMLPRAPEYGGLRFTLRVENQKQWLGYAEETYDVLVPRPPTPQTAAGPAAAALGRKAAAAEPAGPLTVGRLAPQSSRCAPEMEPPCEPARELRSRSSTPAKGSSSDLRACQQAARGDESQPLLSAAVAGAFVAVNGVHLEAHCRPFYVAGMNVENIALAPVARTGRRLLPGEPSGRQKVRLAFKTAAAAGINVRPGEYDEGAFRALDWVVAEAGRAGVRIVLSLVDNWAYRAWGGCGGHESPRGQGGGVDEIVDWSPSVPPRDPRFPRLLKEGDASPDDHTPEHRAYEARRHALFFSNPSCRAIYRAHATALAGRRNTFTGARYRDDPAIMAWGLINELRCSQADVPACPRLVLAWLREMSDFVRSVAPHQIVSGCGGRACSQPSALSPAPPLACGA
eukprot:scaffold4.g4994.t1